MPRRVGRQGYGGDRLSQTHYEEGAGRDRSTTPVADELHPVGSGKSSPNRWKSWAGQLGLLAFGLYFFTRAFAGVDLKELADTIKSGSSPCSFWPWPWASCPG